jgi:hypothetical protein
MKIEELGMRTRYHLGKSFKAQSFHHDPDKPKLLLFLIDCLLPSPNSNLSNTSIPLCLANLAAVPLHPDLLPHPGLPPLLLVQQCLLQHPKPALLAPQPIQLPKLLSRLLLRQAKAQVSLARWLRAQRMFTPLNLFSYLLLSFLAWQIS